MNTLENACRSPLRLPAFAQLLVVVAYIRYDPRGHRSVLGVFEEAWFSFLTRVRRENDSPTFKWSEFRWFCKMDFNAIIRESYKLISFAICNNPIVL